MQPLRPPPSRRQVLTRLATLPAVLMAAAPATTWAHSYRAGSIVIDHPYAVPSPPGSTTGAAYLRRLSNTGAQADRLVAARTPQARAVELHSSNLVDGVMRMRPVPAIELPPGGELRLMHGGDFHLMLIGLAAPLVDGQRFALWLRFERAGEREVMVVVQTPRPGSGMGPANAGSDHKH